MMTIARSAGLAILFEQMPVLCSHLLVVFFGVFRKESANLEHFVQLYAQVPLWLLHAVFDSSICIFL